MPSALIMLAPGFEEIEAVTVIDLLRRAAIAVTVCGLEKNRVTGSHSITLECDAFYGDVNEEEYDVLILPGGQPGSNNLKSNAAVKRWVQNRFRTGRLLAAICAAPTILHAAGITDGLKLTSFPSEKAVFSTSIFLEEAVVMDQNVITSRGVGTAIEFSLRIISELCGQPVADDLRRRIVYTL
jgi:4-methyl-5(b-hydroxyethyl)-thiazole monophosphate biosynthesis